MARLSVRGLGATPGTKFVSTSAASPELLTRAYTGIAMTEISRSAGAGADAGGSAPGGSPTGGVVVSGPCQAVVDEAYAACPELAQMTPIEDAYLMCDQQGAEITRAQIEAVGCTQPWYAKWQTWAIVGGVAAAGLLVWKLKK